MTSLLGSTRAVIFDMDGVLWRSQDAHAEAYRQVLQSAGLEVPPYVELAGRKTGEVMRSLLLRAGRPAGAEQIAALTTAKQAEASRRLRERPPLTPGCVEVLGALARDRKLGLASSASAGSVRLFLDSSGTTSLFSVVLTGDDVLEAKPAPEIYLKALAGLSTRGDEVIVVDDAVSGIRAARAAGTRVIALTGTTSREELAREEVLAVIEDLRELLAA